MANAKEVIGEYVNDDFATCSFIGQNLRRGQRILLFSFDGIGQCGADAIQRWYFGNNDPEFIRMNDLSAISDLVKPGDMVVIGSRNRAITSDEIDQFQRIEPVSKSLTSFLYSKNIAGRIVAASICYQCTESELQK